MSTQYELIKLDERNRFEYFIRAKRLNETIVPVQKDEVIDKLDNPTRIFIIHNSEELENISTNYKQFLAEGNMAICFDDDRTQLFILYKKNNNLTWRELEISQDVNQIIEAVNDAIKDFASKEYVDDKIAEIVDSAPEALNTLNELAKALGEDANFSTTVLNLIGTKVDKVEGKGLSTNDYTNTDALKVSKIKTNGDGTKYLADDGTYKTIVSGGNNGANIDDDNVSSNTTYSSSKIEQKLNTKANIEHTHTELHTHTNKEVLDSITTEQIDKWEEKTSLIDQNGTGNKFLADDGTYKEIESGNGSANIDDNNVSTSTTYSSSKIVSELDVKAHVNHTHDDLHSHVNKNLLDTITGSGDGTKYLSDDGTYKTISNTGGGGSTKVWQKTSLNVQENNIIKINATDNDFILDKTLIQVFKFIEGEKDIIEILKTFDNADSENFYYDSENVVFNGVMKIKDAYEYNITLNSDGLYESEDIDVSSFVNINDIEVI